MYAACLYFLCPNLVNESEEVGDGRGSREGGRGKGRRGRVGRGERWRGRGRDGGVREREWRDDDRVRGRDDEDGESEDDLGWLDGPDNYVEAEKFAQKIGFGVELSLIVTHVAAELKNGLVSCASECPVGFERVEASKRCLKTYDLFDLLSGSFYMVMDCFCEKTWSHTPQYKIANYHQCPDKVQWVEGDMGPRPSLYFNAGITLKITSLAPFAEQ
ncbi:hypothetical protein Droror1_Dr00000088, partial [Drosera rotundifolia]